MKLGFLTACLPNEPLASIVDYAAQQGFQALEVAAWPDLGDRPFTASHIDVTNLSDDAAAEVRGTVDAAGIEISSLAFYDNNLHPDATERAAINSHVHACIDAAARLGCPTVGTFIGRDPRKSVVENMREAEAVFAPLVRHAQDAGVKIVIENCVMEGWHPDGYPGNIAYSPELWRWMFGLGLFLNYDPSHLMWMGIDPVAALREGIDGVVHAQAKDIQLFPHLRNQYGWPGKADKSADPWDVGWWRYRVPGLGEVPWAAIIDCLYEAGFDGALSIEHEDPVWGGDPDRIRTGLEIGARTLRTHLVS